MCCIDLYPMFSLLFHYRHDAVSSSSWGIPIRRNLIIRERPNKWHQCRVVRPIWLFWSYMISKKYVKVFKRMRLARKPFPLNETATMPSETHPILFFDGVCGLCNKSVDFVLMRDKRDRFRFAPLQGETAASMLGSDDVENLNTLILKTESGLYRRTSAVVRILWYLGGFWALLGALLWIIPLPLRNLGYRGVSACRYSLFGKKESCRIPTPSERERFLD